jgi:hypothetical protein
VGTYLYIIYIDSSHGLHDAWRDRVQVHIKMMVVIAHKESRQYGNTTNAFVLWSLLFVSREGRFSDSPIPSLMRHLHTTPTTYTHHTQARRNKQKYARLINIPFRVPLSFTHRPFFPSNLPPHHFRQ